MWAAAPAAPVPSLSKYCVQHKSWVNYETSLARRAKQGKLCNSGQSPSIRILLVFGHLLAHCCASLATLGASIEFQASLDLWMINCWTQRFTSFRSTGLPVDGLGSSSVFDQLAGGLAPSMKLQGLGSARSVDKGLHRARDQKPVVKARSDPQTIRWTEHAKAHLTLRHMVESKAPLRHHALWNSGVGERRPGCAKIEDKAKKIKIKIKKFPLKLIVQMENAYLGYIRTLKASQYCQFHPTSSSASSSISASRLWVAAARLLRASSFRSSTPSICLWNEKAHSNHLKKSNSRPKCTVSKWINCWKVELLKVQCKKFKWRLQDYSILQRQKPKTNPNRSKQPCPWSKFCLVSIISSSSTPASSASKMADLRSRMPQKAQSWSARVWSVTPKLKAFKCMCMRRFEL